MHERRLKTKSRSKTVSADELSTTEYNT